MSGDRAALVEEVNRAYWETDEPVTELAARLGISRRTVYDMIVPRPVGEPCPECGGPLTYSSRSARLNGEALCSICGRTHDLTLLHELSRAAQADLAAEESTTTALATRPWRPPAPLRPIPLRRAPARATLLAGALLMGALAALLLPHLTGRRRRRLW